MKINSAAAETLEWCMRNHMTLNTSKTKQMVISLRDDVRLTNPVKIGDDEIERVNTFRLLGVHIDEHLNFHHHVNDIVERSHTKYHALQLLKRYGVSTSGLCQYYSSIIRTLLSYACQAWFPSLTDYDIKKLEGIQRRCLKAIFPKLDHYSERLSQSKLPTLETFMSNLCSQYSAKVINDPNHRLSHLVPSRQSQHRHSARLTDTLIKGHRTESMKNTIFYKYGV